MALANAPFLEAMIPTDAMSNFGRYGVRHNGAFELRMFNCLAAARAAVDARSARELLDLTSHTAEYIRNLPLRPGTTPLKFAPDYEAWLVEAMRHGDYDFWKDSGASVIDYIPEYKDIPVYHVTGWYDSWGASVANMNYPELPKANKSLQRLIVGPWTHGGQARAFAGDAQFTPDAALSMDSWRARWFDHWLKGADNGVEQEPPVRIYVIGGGDARKTSEGRVFVGGHWRNEQEWPLARANYTPFYIHADGSLSRRSPRVKEQSPTLSIRATRYPHWAAMYLRKAL